ncbi:T9SS type A sorting domain-containing protein [Chitinophaga oryzae]|uniref:T9SS type A sorting domain-containing protein n=1 Tax=Chitinophaga oryzae TaxID=2725414 RepID=A0ABX6LQC4_9BACT|nr:T9SS type A sorting domain-containing protein [Chitinophaga oryzae]QJB42375.1 T9SS type A sorting domain-containing protein [Chitinophaga oryzae]
MHKHIIHMAAWLIIGANVCFAQTGVYVPQGGDVSVHGKDTVAIFSDVRNEGRFGSLKGSVVNFYGSRWENANGAALPDENEYDSIHLQQAGGVFRFLQVKGINSGAQHIYGGYSASAGTGASFPNLSIGNAGDVYLDDLSDLKVRSRLHFETGHLQLNGWNLVVGDGSPGDITGYSDKSFIVTGSAPGGGFLFREMISTADDMVVFPIGTAAGGYAPMALKNDGSSAKTIQARVFDSVYRYALSGNMDASGFVLKTWHLKEGQTALKDVTVVLQHQEADEGRDFSFNRDSSYVTRYRSGGGWDTVKPSGTERPGRITSGTQRRNSYMNSRTIADGGETNTFLSVAAFKNMTSEVALFFEAYRETVQWVGTHWRSTKERNLDHYELQRRREREDSFYTVARMAPHSLNGNSTGPLDYHYRDDNPYDNWTYYRVKIFGRDGKISYSAVKPVPWLIQVNISPNPNSGNFRIDLVGIHHQLRMVMHDAAGRERDSRIISSNSTLISRADLPAGLYILTFYDIEDDNREVVTAKVEIVH